MSNEYVIEAEGLHKRMGETDAVRGLSFAVPAGTVFGLIGPNGAGKTTTIRMLLGLLRPNQGTSRIFGEESLTMSAACRQRIGYLSEEPFPYDALAIDDLLRFVAGFFDQWDWDHTRSLLDRFNLPRDRVLRDMSAGERRRAELLLVLAQRPDLLVLDDPAVGLDASVRREFLWGALEVAREEGKTVLFTSHILQDVERVVDTVAFLREGSLELLEPLEELKARTKRLVFDTGVPMLPGEISREQRGDRWLVTTNSVEDASGAEGVEDLNLEEIFLAYTRRGGVET